MPHSTAQRILIADDQPHVIEALRLLLKSEGYVAEAAKSPASVLKAVQANDCPALRPPDQWIGLV